MGAVRVLRSDEGAGEREKEKEKRERSIDIVAAFVHDFAFSHLLVLAVFSFVVAAWYLALGFGVCCFSVLFLLSLLAVFCNT